MADSRFFSHSGSLTLDEVMALTGAQAALPDGTDIDTSRSFIDVASLEDAQENHISFLDNVKYIEAFTTSKAGACFVHAKYADRAPENMIRLVTEEPYTAYALTSGKFYPTPTSNEYIHPSANISKTATIGKNCVIGAGVFIGDNVVIGDNCNIGANSTISHTLMGNNVTLHYGVHIGQDGFGFAPGKQGIVKVPQLGRVIIGNHVDIGSGTCVDRGAGPDTVIGDHSKIDNLVQIGHNVKIGKYVVIAALCGISGSTKIDDGVMLGGQVGVSGHICIGAGAKVAAASGVMNDIPPESVYGGRPAMPIKDWHRQTVSIAKLSKRK